MPSPSGADVADRMHEKLLRRALRPRQTRKGCPHDQAPHSETQSTSTSEYTIAEAAAQRAIRFALRRSVAIDDRATILEAIGLRDASLRQAALASRLRQAVVQ
jgi:hypothetical protein